MAYSDLQAIVKVWHSIHLHGSIAISYLFCVLVPLATFLAPAKKGGLNWKRIGCSGRDPFCHSGELSGQEIRGRCASHFHDYFLGEESQRFYRNGSSRSLSSHSS